MKEYTLFSVASALIVVTLDRMLGTHVLARRTFWIFLTVMYGFKLIVNGYLTWRPIVLYGREFFMGIRLWTIPAEDFLYGFSLIALSVILWEFFKEKEEGR